MPRLLPFLLAAVALVPGCAAPPPDTTGTPAGADARVPAWAAEAVFYQIFPERFANGDAANDPTHASLEFPEQVPASWQVSPWTGDWYERAAWEKEVGGDFYENGVFNRRYGGDLQGVIDRLDYLKDLGVNALYFNPVFYARSLHKYDGSSFHHIDPYFGPDPEGDLAQIEAEDALHPAAWTWTSADSLFLRLLDEAHARGLRVVIDGVFNHSGMGFFAFQDIRRNGEASPFADWYVVNSWDDPATPEDEFDHEGWWGYKPLPVFSDNAAGTDLNGSVKAYIFDATRRWMDPNADGDPSDGIDGWRLDVANEVPLGFWADWNDLVRELNPEAYTVTEIWEDAAAFLREGGFSATMNYHGFAFPVKGYLVDNAMPPSAFAEALNERREGYAEPVQHVLQNLMDSHDTDRLASMIVNAGRQDYLSPDRFDYDWGERVSPRRTDRYDVRKPNAQEREVQKMVALFQMAYVGAPMIYYGTEAGMWGADDPDDRMPMVWPGVDYADQAADPLGRARTPDPVAFDSTLYRYYQDVIALRKAEPALNHGAFDVLLTDDERGIFAFTRTHEDDALVVVFNRSDEAHSLRIEEAPEGTYEVAFSTADGGYRVQQDAEALLLELPPRAGIALKRR